MSSPPDHDSSLFIRLDGNSENAPLPAIPEMPICDLNSQDPLPAEPLRPSKSPTSPVRPNGADAVDSQRTSSGRAIGNASAAIWRNGDVLMCACPDCQAPMSIRLWLMVADCWQCRLSIELTEEQERDLRDTFNLFASEQGLISLRKLEKLKAAMTGQPTVDEMIAGKDEAEHPFKGF